MIIPDRSMTVFVTSIPKSNPNYYCAEKYNGSLPFKGKFIYLYFYQSLSIIVWAG